MIAIPNMDKPKKGEVIAFDGEYAVYTDDRMNVHRYPLIDIVPCKECKHRPVKEDPNGADYGFNLVGPNEEDDVCPCLVEDGWYSWMPEDNFHCGRGERSSELCMNI